MERLKFLMSVACLRQTELAEISGVPMWQINRCIRHPKFYKFKPEEKKKIAEAFNIPVDYIFNDVAEGEIKTCHR